MEAGQVGKEMCPVAALRSTEDITVVPTTSPATVHFRQGTHDLRLAGWKDSRRSTSQEGR